MVGDEFEVEGIVAEVERVGLDDQFAPFILVENEVVVEAVEVFQVFQRHLLLVGAAALADVVDEACQWRLQVDHQVGHADHAHHAFEELHVGLEVAVVEVAHGVVVDREDVDTFEDAAVLHDGVLAVADGE